MGKFVFEVCIDNYITHVTTEVSTEEFIEMVDMCYDNIPLTDVFDDDETGNIFERIKKIAIDRYQKKFNIKVMADDISISVDYPDGIYDKVNERIEGELSELEQIEYDDYINYPFALNLKDNIVISMTKRFQTILRSKITQVLQISEDDLKKYLLKIRRKPFYEDRRFTPIVAIDYYTLSNMLGFDDSSKEFKPSGIDPTMLVHGSNAIDLLILLGYEIQESGSSGLGVLYIDQGV